jgi:hypothetical protein
MNKAYHLLFKEIFNSCNFDELPDDSWVRTEKQLIQMIEDIAGNIAKR